MNILSIGGGPKEPAMRIALETLPAEKTEVVVVPTACSLQSSYDRKVPATVDFFNGLGLNTSVLHEFDQAPSQDQLEHELGRASLLYTIGGNTPYMLRTMAEYGIDQELSKVIRSGTLHTGTSAGALIPFERIHTNPSTKPTREDWDFEIMNGLGLLRGIATAHASKHDETPGGPRSDSRMDHLTNHFPPSARYGLAIEDNAAVLFGNNAQFIKNTPDANVHLLQWVGCGVDYREAAVSDLSIFDPNA